MQVLSKIVAALVLILGLGTIGFAAFQMSQTPDGIKAAVAETVAPPQEPARPAAVALLENSVDVDEMPDARRIIAEVRARIETGTGLDLPEPSAPAPVRQVAAVAETEPAGDEGGGFFGLGGLTAEWAEEESVPEQVTDARTEVAHRAQQSLGLPQPKREPAARALPGSAVPMPRVSQGLPGNGARADERGGLPQIQGRRRGPIGRPQTGASIRLKAAPAVSLPEGEPLAAETEMAAVQSGGLQIDIGGTPDPGALRREIEARLNPTYTAKPCEDNGVPGVEIANECITVESERVDLRKGQAHLLSEFVDFPNVREISLEGDVGSLEILREFPDVDTIWLFIAKAEDYEVLADLPNLRSLSLDRTNVSDISFLEGMTQLDRLTLVEGSFEDLSVISGLTNVRDLELRKLDISDLSPIAGMTGLEELYLADMPVSDLSPLSGMTSLLQVKLRGMPISDLSPLANATEVRKLLIDEAEVADISPLRGMRNLRSVDLSSNPLSDLSPLEGMEDLRHVAVRKTEVEDVTVLATLPKLRSAHLDETNVADVSALEGSERLKRGTLSLRGTPAAAQQ